MSALGHEQIFCVAKSHVRPTPQKAGIGWRRSDVVFRIIIGLPADQTDVRCNPESDFRRDNWNIRQALEADTHVA